MAVHMFLKLEPIKGEAQFHKHDKEIEVLSWSWGVSRSGTFHEGKGGTAGTAHFDNVTFTHWYDSASVPLLQACVEGTHLTTGELVVVKSSGKETLEYIKVTLSPVLVSSVSLGGSHGEDRLTENVTLNFQKFKVDYAEQEKGGGKGVSPSFEWDIAVHK